MLALLALLACQEPFGTDRHDLAGFRVAALSAGFEGDALVPSPALIVDGRPWSDAPVELRWYWLDDPDQLEDADALEPVATGPAPKLDPHALLGLVAIGPDGAERAAFLPIDEPPPPPTLTVEALPLAVDTVTADDLALDARAALEPTGGPIAPGGFARLRVSPEVARTRWMATAGTFFELDPVTADWAAGEVRVDDDEIVERAPLEPGHVTVLALAIDGGTAWRALDLAVGTEPVGVRVHGRFLPVDTDAAPQGTISATLEADDASPTGLRLVDPGPFEGDWGAPPCAPDAPFDPDWLLEGRCTRAEVVGARVGLVVDP